MARPLTSTATITASIIQRVGFCAASAGLKPDGCAAEIGAPDISVLKLCRWPPDAVPGGYEMCGAGTGYADAPGVLETSG